MVENKCLWCKDELPAGALFCKKEQYKNSKADGCGVAYVKMIKHQKKVIGRELTDFEEGVLKIVHKYKMVEVSATPLNAGQIDASSIESQIGE